MLKKLFFFIFCSANILCANDLSFVLKEMIKTYGGEKALESGLKYHQTWKVLTSQTKKEGLEKREVTLPEKLHTTISYTDKVEKRVLDSDNQYIEYNHNKVEAQGLKLHAMHLQLKRLYNPLILEWNRDKLSLENYDSHYALVWHEDKEKMVYFVDKNSFAITQVTGIIYGQHKVMFNTLYTKFKKFNNILFPTKEYKSANNINTAILELQDITVIDN